MADAGDPAVFVEEWLARAGKDASSPQLTSLLEAAVRGLWLRANVTLGDVTLTAVADRVLTNARERFPFLVSVTAQTCSDERTWRNVHTRAARLDPREVHRGVRYVLTEFLMVIDNVTGGILTPALCDALEGVRPHAVDGPRDPGSPRRPRRRKRKQGNR